jgi:hypothetical protein
LRAWQLLRLQVLERDCYICHCPDCLGGAEGVRLTIRRSRKDRLAGGTTVSS